jgi:hypothetical protein
MTEKLKQTAKDEIAKLPAGTQEAINSLDWGEITGKIGQKYFLDENGINKLQTEVLLVLVEMEFLDDLKANIENSLETTQNEAEKIGDELAEQVFKPIADKIMSSIKDNVRINNVSWDKTVDFIVSGGDYSVFVEK